MTSISGYIFQLRFFWQGNDCGCGVAPKTSPEGRYTPYLNEWDNIQGGNILIGSLSIEPIRNCFNFLRIAFVIAGGKFYFYYIHQGKRSDKERKIVKKNQVLCVQKDIINCLKDDWHSMWVQFYVYCTGSHPLLFLP